MLPGLHSTWPRSTSSRLVPRSSTPTLSPAWPWSSSLRNISTPVQMVFCTSRMPTISTSSPTLTMPFSIRPAAPHRAAAGNGEHVFHRHQERLVDRPLGLRDIGVHLGHQLQDRVLADDR